MALMYVTLYIWHGTNTRHTMTWQQRNACHTIAWYQCTCMNMIAMHVTLYHMSCNGITGPKLMFAVPGHLPEAVHFLFVIV